MNESKSLPFPQLIPFIHPKGELQRLHPKLEKARRPHGVLRKIREGSWNVRKRGERASLLASPQRQGSLPGTAPPLGSWERKRMGMLMGLGGKQERWEVWKDRGRELPDYHSAIHESGGLRTQFSKHGLSMDLSKEGESILLPEKCLRIPMWETLTWNIRHKNLILWKCLLIKNHLQKHF